MADEGLPLLDNDFNIEFSDLKIEKEIGGGAYGQVYKGLYFGTDVAIKKFIMGDDLEEDEKYIAREVAALRNIRHPNVISFMGLCTHPSGIFLVTEWIDQGDLSTFLKFRRSKLSWFQRAVMCKEIAAGMNYIHNKNLVHRDLKPQNILVSDNGSVKICDLGFARKVDKHLRRTMSCAGSPDWMAPEVLMGKKYDNKCDVWGYGAVCCSICGVTVPKRNVTDCFRLDMNKMRLLFKKRAPQCPTAFRDVLLQTLTFDPNERPSFETVLQWLKQLVEELKVSEAEEEEARIQLEEAQRRDLDMQRKRLEEDRKRLEEEKIKAEATIKQKEEELAKITRTLSEEQLSIAVRPRSRSTDQVSGITISPRESAPPSPSGESETSVRKRKKQNRLSWILSGQVVKEAFRREKDRDTSDQSGADLGKSSDFLPTIVSDKKLDRAQKKERRLSSSISKKDRSVLKEQEKEAKRQEKAARKKNRQSKGASLQYHS